VNRLTSLQLKLLRDLWRLRAQAFAIAAVAMCGIASLVTMRGAYEALRLAQHTYYQQYRFADIFASVRRAPLDVADAIRKIEGVADVQARVVFDAPLDVPGLNEPATGRLVSLKPANQNDLNRVYLRAGRLPDPGSRYEILVSEAFASANALQAGAVLKAVINGRREMLTITGIAISPEYINEMRGSGFPDYRRFGVLWMDHEALSSLLDMREGCNDIALTLSPGASEAEVIYRLDSLLENFGGLGAIGREDQLSHQFISNELAQTRVSATVIPAIFLSVAAFLVHNVLLRLSSLQRMQIGLLKSFGYTNAAIASHYMQFALLTVAVGSVAGVALGGWLGEGLAHLYARFFHFPTLTFSLSASLLLTALILSLLSALLGCGLAVYRVLRMTPAEAMRPESPLRYQRNNLERLHLWQHLPLALRMVLRQLLRTPLKTLLTILGLSMSGALVITGLFSFDALNEVIRFQYRVLQRDEISVMFNEEHSIDIINHLRRLPGVLRAEGFLSMPVKLRVRHREKRTAIIGLERQRQLRLTVDADERSIELPDEGLACSRMLADLLSLKIGEKVEIHFLTGRRQKMEIPVTLILEEPIGTFAYMDMLTLSRLLQKAPTTNGAWLALDMTTAEAFYRTIKVLPAMASTSLREATIQSFLATVGENIRINNTVLVSFACVIAAGIIYNSARIALSEHATELASLRILGFTRNEVTVLLLTEQWLLTAIAIPLGCLIGYGLAAGIAALLSQELFRIPLIVSGRTFLFAALVVTLSAIASSVSIGLRLRQLDFIAVLKTRE
jgi:putative ABC transport system permease protein